MGPCNKKRQRLLRLESPPLKRLSARANRVSLSPVQDEVTEDVPIVSQTQESVEVATDGDVDAEVQSPLSIASPTTIAKASLSSPIKVDNEAIKAMVNGNQTRRPQQSNLELVKRPSFASLGPTTVLSFLRDPLIDVKTPPGTTPAVSPDNQAIVNESTIVRECQNFFGKITYTRKPIGSRPRRGQAPSPAPEFRLPKHTVESFPLVQWQSSINYTTNQHRRFLIEDFMVADPGTELVLMVSPSIPTFIHSWLPLLHDIYDNSPSPLPIQYEDIAIREPSSCDRDDNDPASMMLLVHAVYKCFDELVWWDRFQARCGGDGPNA